MKTIKVLALSCSMIWCSVNQFALATNKLSNTNKIFKLSPKVTEKDYQAGVINFRIKEQYRNICSAGSVNNPAFNAAISTMAVTKMGKIFPRHQKPEQKLNKYGKPLSDLSLIYRLNYSANMPIEIACNQLLKTGIVEYAEPNYVYEVSAYTTNDPDRTSQAFLTRIKAYDAWDIALGGSQGDTSVVIGIVDSGSDTDHPDLMANIKHNYADPINNIDDDQDGYVDNFTGWDLAGADYQNIVEDNNPNCVAANNDHGSHVSGCASEVTDNNIGGSGIGFKCKILPIKCGADNDFRGAGGSGLIIGGYEGITYAADHGCQIINCSWGGEGQPTLGQNVIDYAIHNKNALVVVAAGNDNSQDDFFPACFDGVFSVAATNSTNDVRAGFSNFNYKVGISAPGVNIYTTIWNNSYASLQGTSMASPIVAGAAGLVKSKFPMLSAEQLRERLRVTADNHYTGPNSSYKGKLGKGRLNVFKALTLGKMPSVRMKPINIIDGNDEAFVANDTLHISGDFYNYLDSTSSACTVTLTATGPFASDVTVLNGTLPLGSIPTFGTFSNSSNPFNVVISPNASPNAKVSFRLAYTDGTYTDEQYFDVVVNVDYINVHVNEIATSVTSKGRLFFNGDSKQQGLGFVYKDSSLAYEGGLMVGVDANHVMNNVRTETATPADDWVSTMAVRRVTVGPVSDFDIIGKFDDSGNQNPIQLDVNQKFYAWNLPGETRYVIHEYTIKNRRVNNPINGLWAGIFIDWDIENYDHNKSDQDAGLKLGYAYCSDLNGFYAGVKLLTQGSYNFYAADNITGGAGGINVADGCTDSEKYMLLSTSRAQAGVNGQGNDVINVVSTGQFNINVGDSVVVAFAIIAGDDLTDIQTSAAHAQFKYDGTTALTKKNGSSTTKLGNCSPNPAKDNTSISFDLAESSTIELSIRDIKGDVVKTIASEKLNAGKYNYNVNLNDLSAGVYTYQLKTNNALLTNKLIVVK